MSVSLVDGHIDNDTPGMTDNEIIKALECCISKWTCDTNCPMWSVQHCGFKLRKYALDLINRQKAEIDKMRDYIELLEIEKEALKKKLTHSIGIDNTKENGCFPFD